MNKSDLVKMLSKETDLPPGKTEEVVNTVFETMAGALGAGDRIEVRGFGAFSIRHYDGYSGRNPKTGEEITVEPKKRPFFKPGKNLRAGLNQK
jgi:integration host factor subunit beta